MDVVLALSWAQSWAMYAVEQNSDGVNTILSINVRTCTCTCAPTPAELHLLSRVPATDPSTLFHRMTSWHSVGRVEDCSMKLECISGTPVHQRHAHLRLYEGDTAAIAAVFVQEHMLGDRVLMFWDKMKLHVHNPAYGLGQEAGSHRFDGMKRVV